MNKQWLSIALGLVTATGGFLDAGTVAIILLVEMVGRFTAVSKKTYAEAIREDFGFRFYLLPLASELIAESLMLAAELGGVAIALSLFTGISWHTFYPFVALFVWVLVWRAPFDLIENGPAFLGLVTLSFLAGIVALGGIPVQLFPTLWHPTFQQGTVTDYLYLVAAILGATISPYLLYFYSSGAREEHWSGSSLLLNRVTAIVGMGFGSMGSLALLVLGALVLQPLNISSNTLGELGLAMAKPFGIVGSLLFASVLFVTCLSASSCWRFWSLSSHCRSRSLRVEVNMARDPQDDARSIRDILDSQLLTSDMLEEATRANSQRFW
jgi:Mn2+/Fe2+ NRAMP family transporter